MITRPPIEGNTCNLECLRKNPVKTFDGPMKIVLIDIPRKEYCQRIWWAGFIGFAYILMGYYTITMLLFSSSWKVLHFETNLHIFLCTAGFQLLMPAGILMMTSLHGPTTPLKPCFRKVNHVLLQITAAILNTVGSVLLFVSRKNEWPDILHKTMHCLFGMIALVLMGLALLFGAFAFTKKACCRSFHAILGLIAFIFSSICFILAIFLPNGKFIPWINNSTEIAKFMALLCIIATFIVVGYSVMKLFCCYERYCDQRI